MKKRITLLLAVLTGMALFTGAALAERDWSRLMTMPTEEQLQMAVRT